MMMIISNKTRRRDRARFHLFILLGISAVLLVVALLLHRLLASLVLFVAMPVFLFFGTLFAPIGSWWYAVGNARAVYAENTALKAEVASTSAALAATDAIALDNAQLRALLGRTDEHNALLATVLVRPPATPYDTLLLDVGSADGVATGQLVAAGGSLVLGTIGEVTAHTARVHLVSSPGDKYEALLQHASSTTSIPVETEGLGGGSLRMTVPADTAVQVGDFISFPTVHSSLAARVTGVVAPADDTAHMVYATLPVNPFALTRLVVWRE